MRLSGHYAKLLISSLLLLSSCMRNDNHDTTRTQHIISLAPNITEIICAIDAQDQLAGRTSACDYPPDKLAGIPVIGGFGVPSMEQIVSVNPTIILDVDLEDESVELKFERLGLHRLRIPCAKLDEIPPAINIIGELTGHQPQALALSASLAREIQALRTSSTAITNPPLVYAEIWHDPMTTAGRTSFLSELVRLAGGRNAGDEVEKDYFTVSSEWIIKLNPDVIFCFYMSDGISIAENMESRPGWSSISAIRNNAVYDGFDNAIVLRPGPRVVDGIRIMAERLGKVAQLQ